MLRSGMLVGLGIGGGKFAKAGFLDFSLQPISNPASFRRLMPAVRRGSLRGSTRPRQGTAYPDSTSTGRRTGIPRNVGGAGTRPRPGRWKDRWKIRELLADERCSQAVLDFLSSTDVGRRVPAEEEDTRSEVSEGELR